MTAWQRWHAFPSAFAYEQIEIRRANANHPRVVAARRAAAPPPPAAMSAEAAIQMSGYRVIVTERRTRGLVDSHDTTCISPPQSEQQARSLIALLAAVAAAACEGSLRRQPVAAGQRIIELEHQR